MTLFPRECAALGFRQTKKGDGITRSTHIAIALAMSEDLILQVEHLLPQAAHVGREEPVLLQQLPLAALELGDALLCLLTALRCSLHVHSTQS